MSILKDGMRVFASKDAVIAGGDVFRVEIESAVDKESFRPQRGGASKKKDVDSINNDEYIMF